MPYDVLTFDTQTFYKNHRTLDRGYLGQLSQFKDGPVEVVFTEIVLREIHKALIEKAQAPLEALGKLIKDGGDNGQLSAEQKAALQQLAGVLSPASDHAKAQLQSFVEATSAEVIPAEKAAIKDVLAAYFGKSPPFSSKGKKDEFPDAISLLALEAWAKQGNKMVLAVSADGDWKTFAETSAHIECVENLGDAIATIVQAAEASIDEARRVLEAVAAEEPPELKGLIDGAVADEVGDLIPYVEFDSAHHGEEEGVYLVLQHYAIAGLDDGTTPIDIVRIAPAGFVMRVPVKVTARAFVDISFSVTDWVDKDEVPIGSTSIEKDVDFGAFALITCDRVEQGDADVFPYEISHVELVELPSSIDVGHVELSFAAEDDDFDLEDFQAQPEQ